MGQGRWGSSAQPVTKADAEAPAPEQGEAAVESPEDVALADGPGPDLGETEAETAAVASASRPTAGGAESYQQRMSRGAIGANMLMVNGEAITIEDILDPIMAELERNAKVLAPNEYSRMVRHLVSGQIWQQVNERLVYREAAAKLDERMLQVLDAEVDRFIRQRVNAEFGGRQSRFEKHLAELGRSLDDVREHAKRHLLVSDYLRRKFTEQVAEGTRAELWQYYQSHLEDFTTPASAELFLIDIPYDAFAADRRCRPGSADWLRSKVQARRQAEKARAELVSGMPFAAVARTYSKGIHAADGGSWGAIGSSSLVGRYRAATEALAGMGSHEHSEVIEGEEAYFIVGTGQVQPAQVPSFEQAQPRIKGALRRERMAELEREYLEKLRQRANVQRWQEFQLEVLRAIPQPKPMQGVSGTTN